MESHPTKARKEKRAREADFGPILPVEDDRKESRLRKRFLFKEWDSHLRGRGHLYISATGKGKGEPQGNGD